MNTYIYKQNTGVLSKNQNVILTSTTRFRIKYYDLEGNIKYSINKCGNCYRITFISDENGIVKITPSTADYQYYTFVPSEYVYKENGSIYVDLSASINRVMYVDINIRSNQTIMISYGDSNKVVLLK